MLCKFIVIVVWDKTYLIERNACGIPVVYLRNSLYFFFNICSCSKLDEKLEQLTERKTSRDTDLQNAETRLQDEAKGEDVDKRKYV